VGSRQRRAPMTIRCRAAVSAVTAADPAWRSRRPGAD
jgi:hypothetical protein